MLRKCYERQQAGERALRPTSVLRRSRHGLVMIISLEGEFRNQFRFSDIELIVDVLPHRRLRYYCQGLREVRLWALPLLEARFWQRAVLRTGGQPWIN